MKTMKTEIPEGTDEVTLVLKKSKPEARDVTLRDILPRISGPVTVVVMTKWTFNFGRSIAGSDHVEKNASWRVDEDSSLMIQLLEKSSLVDGEKILGLVPGIRVEEGIPSLIHGSVVPGGNPRTVLTVMLED